MAAPSYARSPFGLAKRLKIMTPAPIQARTVYQSRQSWQGDKSMPVEIHRGEWENKARNNDYDQYMAERVKRARGVSLPAREPSLPDAIQKEVGSLRLPRSVQLNYMTPLKRAPTHGVPAADLQLRSYSVRNLEYFSDFALRAAYYLNLPAKGPVPLPRITERWTVPRANFVFKKSQENFERRTLRRLIQIQDADPEAVQIWLGFLQKYAYHGVGMKANVWEYSSLDVGKEMDVSADAMKEKVKQRLSLFGGRKDVVESPDIEEVVHDAVFRGASGNMVPMGSTQYNRL